jgi:TonB family protein
MRRIKLLMRLLVLAFLIVGTLAFAQNEQPFPDLIVLKGIQPTKLVRPNIPSANALFGKVWVGMAVSKEGTVTASKIVSSDIPRTFDDAVLAAVTQWRFPPQFVEGAPIAYQTTVAFDFHRPLASAIQPPIFVWDTANIHAEVKQHGQFCTGDTQRQYIHLTRTDGSKFGWTMINLIIPSQWRVDHVAVEEGDVRIVEDDGTAYTLTKDNVENLMRRLRGCPLTEERSQAAWTELASAGD